MPHRFLLLWRPALSKGAKRYVLFLFKEVFLFFLNIPFLTWPESLLGSTSHPSKVGKLVTCMCHEYPIRTRGHKDVPQTLTLYKDLRSPPLLPEMQSAFQAEKDRRSKRKLLDQFRMEKNTCKSYKWRSPMDRVEQIVLWVLLLLLLFNWN